MMFSEELQAKLSSRVKYTYHNANSLLAQKSSLRLTPLQAILQYFERHHTGESLAIGLQSFREVLDLLPQCDWSVVHPDGWVAADPEGRRKSTVTSPEVLIKRHIEPLLGPIEDTGEFIRQLAQMSAEQKDALAQQMEQSQAQSAELKAQGALDGRISTRESAGAPPKEERNNPDNIRIKDWGTSAAYLASRIMKAGREDLLSEIGPGKHFKSVRAAAIAAGIVKDIPTVRLTDPAKAATAVLQKQGREWAAQMAAALTELLTQEAGHE